MSTERTRNLPATYRRERYLLKVWRFTLGFGLLSILGHVLSLGMGESDWVSGSQIREMSMMAWYGFQAIGTLAFAGIRISTTHPLAKREYLEFLYLTPWRIEKPLPWGTPHWCREDLLILSTLIGFSLIQCVLTDVSDGYVDIQLYGLILLLGIMWMIVSRAGAAAWAYWNSNPLSSWGIVFLVPVIFWVFVCTPLLSEDFLFAELYWNQHTGIQALIALICVALWIFERSLIKASLRKLSDFLVSAESQTPLVDRFEVARQQMGFPATGFPTSRQFYGWLFNRLSPAEKFLSAPLRDRVILSLWVGWMFLLAYPMWTLHPSNTEALVNALTVISGLLGLLRVVIYLNALPDPLARWKLRQWIIPREDRILLAPLAMLLVSFVGRWLFERGAEPIILMPTWITTVLLIVFCAGPSLREHKLTTSISLRAPIFREPSSEQRQRRRSQRPAT